MSPAEVFVALAPVATLIGNVLAGQKPDPADAAKTVVKAALAFAPVEELKGYLDDEARARQDALFELEKRRKFGGPDG